MKNILVMAVVVVVLTTVAYAVICSQDCSKCSAPCEMKSLTPVCGGDAPKCDPNSKPEAKCGGEKPKCDPNNKPEAKCGGVDPNKPKCEK